MKTAEVQLRAQVAVVTVDTEGVSSEDMDDGDRAELNREVRAAAGDRFEGGQVSEVRWLHEHAVQVTVEAPARRRRRS